MCCVVCFIFCSKAPLCRAYTATSSGIEVQDKQDGGDGMDRRAKEHVGVSGLRRGSLCESMAGNPIREKPLSVSESESSLA